MGEKGAALTERGGMRSHMEKESRPEGMSQSSEFYNWEAQRHITCGHGENLDTVQWRETKPGCRSVSS